MDVAPPPRGRPESWLDWRCRLFDAARPQWLSPFAKGDPAEESVHLPFYAIKISQAANEQGARRRHMKATLARADVTYEVSFKKPLFDQGAHPPLVQSVYDTLSDNFSISLPDVGVNAGPAPSHIFVVMNLFGGAGSVELRLDRWRASFKGLMNENDRKLIIRCLNLVTVALEGASDRISPARTVLTVASWYKCDEGAPGVASMLSEHGSLGIEVDRGFLGAEQIDYTINPHMRNPTEGWDALFFIQESQLEGTHLFLNYTGNYVTGGRYNSVDQKADHIATMISGMLGALGVVLPSS